MNKLNTFGLIVLAVGLAHSSVAAADDSGHPHVGEVRSMAIASDNTTAVAGLHRDGWMEARGQLLSAGAYPELFQAVGRTWTAATVEQGQFAVPAVRDRSPRGLSSDNPYGVLGPGDLVTGGRVTNAWLRQAPMTYWIFAGREVTPGSDAVARR